MREAVDLPTGAERATLIGHRTEVLSLAFSPDGKTLATGGRDGTIKLWDVLAGERRTLRGHSKLVKSIAFSPDGRNLLSGSWDWSAKIWDLATGQAMQTLTGHGAAIARCRLHVANARGNRELGQDCPHMVDRWRAAREGPGKAH